MKLRTLGIAAGALTMTILPVTTASADQPYLLDGPACHGQIIGGMASGGYGLPNEATQYSAGQWNKFIKDLCAVVNG